ncbi:MAG: SusC/RagA family TonB-linked outer membrane protein, partial [Cyclobacteriaceae bacterium]|nr:SusC/RagA family TonB-linked outer membrane protein [Cyclobacteriaceae bacterium]
VVLNDLYGIELVAIPGKPIGVIMGHTEKTDPQGRIIVNNAGLPQVATDKVEYGNINADFTMGLSTTVRYKDFSLSANMDYRKGGLMYAYTQRLTQFVGNSTNSLYNDRKPWVVPNSVVQVGTDEYVENTIPIDYANVYAYWNQTSNNSRSKDHVIDRSFMKLREVTLGYRVPESILSKTPISSLYVNLVGRNLLLFTPLENNIIDPETTTFGNDLLSEFGEFGVGPTLRSYGLSLKATF